MTLERRNTKLWVPRFWVRAKICLHPAIGAEPRTTKPTASHRISITRRIDKHELRVAEFPAACAEYHYIVSIDYSLLTWSDLGVTKAMSLVALYEEKERKRVTYLSGEEAV
jgi:hypothetical protein